ncbi:uncharacterized protein EI90DRAFT_1391414 [Cantharellus anzutake]|uniref:uncharacterized protein n=1 Tax=Cantharellus anzutake TaxID=1750568 RepID=UPI001906F181|nr:uncharacterized protein EI90DRAFT_1391414 [Cantharellus anzutake]KAF8329417.1 hypothetical protein EI90DRAFT_1391414 [Cantharellus anzutake]
MKTWRSPARNQLCEREGGPQPPRCFYGLREKRAHSTPFSNLASIAFPKCLISRSVRISSRNVSNPQLTTLFLARFSHAIGTRNVSRNGLALICQWSCPQTHQLRGEVWAQILPLTTNAAHLLANVSPSCVKRMTMVLCSDLTPKTSKRVPPCGVERTVIGLSPRVVFQAGAPGSS